jgi:hypothetical protein
MIKNLKEHSNKQVNKVKMPTEDLYEKFHNLNEKFCKHIDILKTIQKSLKSSIN